ncbi:MAG: phage/plasmid primase, P4 family [Nanoarchaeota archaeon]
MTILDNIFDLIGKNNFFRIDDFSNSLSITQEEAKELLDYGIQKGIVMETISDQEYAFKDIYQEEDYKNFSEFIDKNFAIGNIKPIRLDSVETELKDEILQNIALRKKDRSSELLVKHIERNNHIYTIRDDLKSEMWIYQNGIYVPQGESFVKEYCRKILGGVYTSQLVNLILDKIKTDTFIEQSEFFKQENTFEVPVKNGILNILTKKLSIFNPRKIFFNKLNVVYDPSKDCPKIENHFKTILRNEDDSKVMFELFGYLLLKENKLEKAFMFIGNGRNGKSKTLELIKKFLGIENCSALPLSSMNSESFSLSELFGKMVNLAGDLSYTDLKETGILKQLIGRDEIQAKRKFLRDLNFVNYSKLIFACNELPKVYDLTDGFWTKWVLLEFPYKFIAEKEYNLLEEDKRENKKIMNPDIVEYISSEDELSGLLNKALESLDLILENKEFSYSKGTSEVKDIWIRQSDSFMSFCFDRLEEDYNNKISRKDLKKEYFKYCKKYRSRFSSDKSIKITLENMFGAIETRMNDTSLGWDGIRFKQNCEICEGISPYKQITNSPIGSKNLSNLTNQENSLEEPVEIINIQEKIK